MMEENTNQEINNTEPDNSKGIKTFLILIIVASICFSCFKFFNSDVRKIEKLYNFYAEVFKKAVQDKGTVDTWDINSTWEMYSVLTEYLPIDKDCGTDDVNRECFERSYPRLKHNGEIRILDNGFYKYSLKNGSTGAILHFINPKCDGNASSTNTPPLNSVCLSIWFDVNGKKEPNVYGIDLFQFLVTKSGEIVPRGHVDDGRYNIERHCSNIRQDGDACLAWILYKKNMDYLKIDPVVSGK